MFFSHTSLAIFIGIFLALTIRWLTGQRYGHGSAEAKQKVKQARSLFSSLTVDVIIPLLFLETVLNNRLTETTTMSLIIAGFFIPFVFLAASIALIPRVAPQSRPDVTWGIALSNSTSGGGNRGHAFIVAVFAVHPQLQTILSQFLLLDLGNFIFLLLAGPWLIRYFLRTASPEEEHKGFTPPRSLVISGGVALFALGKPLLPENLITPLLPLLESTAPIRSFLLPICAFAALTLGIAKPKFLSPKLLLTGYSARLASIGLLWLASLYFPYTLPSFTWLALGTLALCPPSSLFPAMLEKEHCLEETISESSLFTASQMIVFLIILIISIGYTTINP